MAAEELIALRGLRFGYPGRAELFTGLDLAIGKGERVGLVGANGSGKTTLLHVVMGLLKPSGGGVTVLGHEVRAEEDFLFVRQKLGLLFQDPDDQLFCPTVAEDVAFGPLNLGAAPEEAREIVLRTLDSLGLADYAGRVSHELSGGEKRLVALAAVLAMEPEALLLDEPSAGLDPRSSERLIALLAGIGKSQVVCSHNMEFVRATCQRVVVLDAGRVIGDGPTDEILGDAELMLGHGLEVPFSIEARHGPHDHRHGGGTSHGHGHREGHRTREHRAAE